VSVIVINDSNLLCWFKPLLSQTEVTTILNNNDTVKPELAVTSIKQPTCLKQLNKMFPKVNFVQIFTSVKQPLFVLPLCGCLTQGWLYSWHYKNVNVRGDVEPNSQQNVWDVLPAWFMEASMRPRSCDRLGVVIIPLCLNTDGTFWSSKLQTITTIK